MNQIDRIPNGRRTANDPVLTIALRYTLPLAIVGIAALLAFLGWGLSL